MSSSLSYTEFLKRFNRERKKNGITQVRIAGILGISQGHASRLARGKNIFSAKALLKLHAEGFDIHRLLTGENPEKTELNKWLEEHNIQAHALKPDSHKDYRLLLSLIEFCLERRGEGNLEEAAAELDFLKRCFHPVSHRGGENAVRENAVRGNNEGESAGEDGNAWPLLRSAFRLHQKEMADQLGVDIKKYSRIESGKDLPDAELLIKASERWGIAPEILLGQPEGYLKELNSLWRRLGIFDRNRILEALDTLYK